jgi:uncharacterized protein (DUF305 family)
MRLLFTLLLASLVAVLAACANDTDDQNDIVETDDQTELTDDAADDQVEEVAVEEDDAAMDDDAATADDDHAAMDDAAMADDDEMEAADRDEMGMELDDETFLAAMIEHHEGAVDMAEIALERAEHEELRQVAQEIIDAQEAEIEQMEAWLDEWYHGVDVDHGVSHEEMGMDMDMDAFRDAEPFDLAFIDEMILHHEGAIDMARAVLETTERDEIRAMAEEIIDVQEREIEQMREWRAEWYED